MQCLEGGGEFTSGLVGRERGLRVCSRRSDLLWNPPEIHGKVYVFSSSFQGTREGFQLYSPASLMGYKVSGLRISRL